MSDLTNFTGKFRVRKTSSHQPVARKDAKRPRLACKKCQESKLRCDRSHPCSNCVKKGELTRCTYQHDPEPRPGVDGNTIAEDRLSHLESMVRQLMKAQEPSQIHITGASSEIVRLPDQLDNPAATTTIAVDAHRNETAEDGGTGYVGSTHWSAILDDIQDLKAVLGNSPNYRRNSNLILSENSVLNRESIYGSPREYSLQQILANTLPSKVQVDRYLAGYFQGGAFIAPCLHTYQFQRQYREFWKDPTEVNPLWLSILFSICYMSSQAGGPDAYNPSQNGPSGGRPDLHAAAGQCLVLGEYHQPQPFAVEALALYGHGKSLRSLDPSREVGAILGMVIRMAYETGLHRDPDSLGSFTPFEGEMRRRLWASCKHMDLMVSFQLGLPSNICLEDCDTKSPRNLLDSDFDTDTDILPASRPENEPTGLLWFIVKERQMIGFSKVCQDALSFKEKSTAEIIQLDKEIREMYITIPALLRTRPLSESIADAPFLIMTRLYVEFIYLKSLCVLHRKYMTRGNSFSTRCCVEAGTKLVSQFIDVYKEFSPGGQLHKDPWMLSTFTMTDFLLGVMVLCLVVHTRRKSGSPSPDIDASTERKVLALLEQSHAICVEKSSTSKDARRVSQAIRITSNGAKALEVQQIAPSHSSPFQTPLSSLQSTNTEASSIDPQYLSLPPWHGYLLEGQDTFGLFDSSQFTGDGTDNMDWDFLKPQT